MTNKFFGTKLLATALATFALASCQSESSLVEPSSNNRRDVELTVTATKGELMTRTDINLSNDEKKLIKTWDLGDRIHVCESNGAYVGYLDVTGLNEDHTQATFKGVVSLLDNDGKQTLSFVTLGKGMDEGYNAKSGKQMTAVEYDFTNQTNPASVASLGDYDLMFTDCEVEVKGGNATFVDLQLKREFAFGRFTLLYNDVPLQFDANTVVTIDTEAGDMKSGASIVFPKTVTPNRTTSLSITTNENDFYVRMVPGSEQGRIKFNVTVNGEAYEGYSSSFLIEKNDFFRFNEGGPLPINVKRTDGSDDEHNFSLTYNANYGSNDTWTDNQNGVGLSFTYTLSEYGKIFDETNEGYDFVGWNTSADGTGETLNPGSEYTVQYPDGTATLYAQWKQKEYNWQFIWVDELSFGDNAVTYGRKLESGEAPKTLQSAFPTDLPSSKWYNNMVKDGYTFLGWEYNGKMVGKNGNTYKSSDIVANKGTETVTVDGKEYYPVYIYAKWEKKTYEYTLIHEIEGDEARKESFTVAEDPFEVSVVKNAPVVVAPAGYEFKGWAKKGTTTIVTSVSFTHEELTIIVEPVFEKLPTVTTPGYKPGTFN